ncbi:MAG: hypothetical protein Q4C52_00540 [Eubacteriales bacterium]|nr:hypothetical protein [Eubacteriales bacterium]
MDKRMEENQRVKTAIAIAFMELLKNKSLEAISISELTSRAKVSRMAYYRNFSAKLEIIQYFAEEIILKEIYHCFSTEELNFWSIEYGIAFFSTMKKYREQILLLNTKGYSGLILESFNKTNEELAGDMPSNSIRRYHLYYAAGASFNGVLVWLQNGCKESVEEIVNSIYSFFNWKCQ